MIRRSGYAILALLSYGIIESLLLGYKYYIILTILLFFTVAFEVIYFNIYGSRAVSRIYVKRESDTVKFRKNRKFKITLHFTNENKYPVTVHFFDEGIDILEISGNTGGNIKIPANGYKNIEYWIVPRYIGKYQFGDIRITVSDLFHIASIQKNFLSRSEIHISPSMSDIKSSRSEMLSSFLYTFGNHYSHKVGQGYNLYGVRPYTFDDDPRYIVWSRYDEINNNLLVKQMEEEREITTIFIVDYSTSMNYGSSDRIYDRAVLDIINSSYFMIKNRDNVGFLLYSDSINIYIPPDKGGKSIENLEKEVSNLIPSGNFNPVSALKYLEKKQKKNALLFLITASPSAAESLGYRRNLTIFIVNHESYYDYSPNGEFDGLLIHDARFRELNSLARTAGRIRNRGVRCTYVSRGNMMQRILLEYNYGRSMNKGAS
ncbi:MAG: DUF58 domain-containing protein [Ferroplasma sp.]|uniref:DUF58 domain-containing protein n=1 Tax=Ferroplasma sp. TaxID=2591003 RepID=UPI0028153484|nr:DUF58 domain-containing protein [Ferroplasma sp.]WMT51940.1 MAG: DUF58 domain-containing protein [Ferroplasma sp.]